MIEVILSGGLGNQLFQYAYAKKLQQSLVLPGTIILNGESLRLRDAVRNPELGHFLFNKSVCVLPEGLRSLWHLFRFFSGPGSVLLREKISYKLFHRSLAWSEATFHQYVSRGLLYVSNPHACWLPQALPQRHCYCVGFFQNYETVRGMEDALREDLRIKEPLSGENARLLQRIQSTNSVCVHIRRGDYLENRYKMFHVCNEQYFQDAMEEARERLDHPTFYIFSGSREDVRWVKEHYHLSGDVHYVEADNDTISDFQLMASCKHFIISNSTYSWWCALLGADKEKQVWAPAYWRRDMPELADAMYAPEWRRVAVCL